MHEHFLGNTAAEQNRDFFQHLVAVIADTVEFRQLPGQAQCPAARHDGDLVHRVGLRQQLGDYGMTGFMVSGVAALFFAHDHGAALGTHEYLVLGVFEILHLHRALVAIGGNQRSFVDQIGQIGAGKTGRAARNDIGLDVRINRHLAHVHHQNLFTAADVGQTDHHLTVEPAGAQQGLVQHVCTVGGGNDDDAGIGFKAVEFNQQLVQRLFTLVVAAAGATAAMTADSIDFIDENNAWCTLLRLLEHVAHTCCADTDEHFNEVGTGDGEERHLRLAGNGFRQQCLAGTGRADHQHAAWNARAQFLEFSRIAQKFDQLGDLLLGFVAACNVGKRHLIGAFIQLACTALAERERTALASTLHLTHEEYPDADQQQHREPGNEDAHQQRLLFVRLGFDDDIVFQQVGNQPWVGRRIGIELATIIGLAAQYAPINRHLGDLPLFHLIDELGIDNLTFRRGLGAELIEYGHQHQSDDEPYCDVLDDVVQNPVP